jgi:hypothetical protein
MPILHLVAIRRLEDRLAPFRGLAQGPEHILLWQVTAQFAENFGAQDRVRFLFVSANPSARRPD